MEKEKSFNSFLEDFAKSSPMKSLVVNAGDQVNNDLLVKQMEKEGYKVASLSNAGCAPGKVRITFLHHSCFNKN